MLYEIDCNILLWIQEHLRCDFLNVIMKFITSLGNAGIIWIILTIIMLITPKYRKAGFASAVSLLFSLLVINLFMKNWIARVRPYEVISGLELLVGKATDWSFPSGHASSSFASACCILFTGYRKEGIAALILAFLIGFSRLYVGIHYPSDVLCGALLGLGFAIMASFIVNKIYKKFSRTV